MKEIKFRAWKQSENRLIQWHELKDHSQLSEILQGVWLQPMQFTGLHDKNGKEIYEGDVVKCQEDVCIVGWHDRFASFVLSKNGWLHNHFFAEAFDPQDCEIIGNIYEFPELLKTDSESSC